MESKSIYLSKDMESKDVCTKRMKRKFKLWFWITAVIIYMILFKAYYTNIRTITVRALN